MTPETRAALHEVEQAATAMRDARSLRDTDLWRIAARRAARQDPALLPPLWAQFVTDLRRELGEP